VLKLAFTFSKLAETTLGSSATTITFSNIPQNYTDLVLKTSFRSTTTNVWVQLAFNGLTTNMSVRLLQGDGSTATSGSYSSALYNILTNGSGTTASTFASSDLYLPNYTSSNNKSYSIDTVDENNATLANSALEARLWANTTAINQITLTAQAGALAQYSTATLYGVRVEL